MQKFLDLFNKFSATIIAAGAAYWAIVGLIGYDLIGAIFAQLHLYFIVRIVYLIVGAAGIIKLLEIYKPDLLENMKKKK